MVQELLFKKVTFDWILYCGKTQMSKLVGMLNSSP